MNHELPTGLESTKNLLAGSLHFHASEQAPTIPGDLVNDLARRFNPAQSVAAPLKSRSWFATIQSFVARPAFGIAALAVVILGISVPSLVQPKSAQSNGHFRGSVTSTTEAQNLSIILIQAPSNAQKAIEGSGDFEKGVISAKASIDPNTNGPRIIVDFTTSTITAMSASGEQLYTAPMPADTADLSGAIATAASRL